MFLGKQETIVLKYKDTNEWSDVFTPELFSWFLTKTLLELQATCLHIRYITTQTAKRCPSLIRMFGINMVMINNLVKKAVKF